MESTLEQKRRELQRQLDEVNMEAAKLAKGNKDKFISHIEKLGFEEATYFYCLHTDHNTVVKIDFNDHDYGASYNESSFTIWVTDTEDDEYNDSVYPTEDFTVLLSMPEFKKMVDKYINMRPVEYTFSVESKFSSIANKADIENDIYEAVRAAELRLESHSEIGAITMDSIFQYSLKATKPN